MSIVGRNSQLASLSSIGIFDFSKFLRAYLPLLPTPFKNLDFSFFAFGLPCLKVASRVRVCMANARSADQVERLSGQSAAFFAARAGQVWNALAGRLKYYSAGRVASRHSLRNLSALTAGFSVNFPEYAAYQRGAFDE
ncbi:hypothetical protein PQR62_04320 [Herbaspirillum lusitanum]|uniref:Uncharacterized protein n=1 Tax=Herbaspirillum lusitanum TaxID=213312 RepID=A0ABW9A3L5_9BURK